jgi:hypothetical protein
MKSQGQGQAMFIPPTDEDAEKDSFALSRDPVNK